MLIVANDDRAEAQVGVPAHSFGHAVNYDAGPEVERTLQQWSREGVIDDAQDAPLARERAEAGEVGDAEQRVRRRSSQSTSAPSHAAITVSKSVTSTSVNPRPAQLLQVEQAVPDIHVGNLGRDDGSVVAGTG